MFTIALQMNFDFYIDMGLKGYCYFTKEADWEEFPTNFLLVPPVNMIFLNFFPFQKRIAKKVMFFILFIMEY